MVFHFPLTIHPNLGDLDARTANYSGSVYLVLSLRWRWKWFPIFENVSILVSFRSIPFLFTSSLVHSAHTHTSLYLFLIIIYAIFGWYISALKMVLISPCACHRKCVVRTQARCEVIMEPWPRLDIHCTNYNNCCCPLPFHISFKRACTRRNTWTAETDTHAHESIHQTRVSSAQRSAPMKATNFWFHSKWNISTIFRSISIRNSCLKCVCQIHTHTHTFDLISMFSLSMRGWMIFFDILWFCSVCFSCDSKLNGIFVLSPNALTSNVFFLSSLIDFD